MRSKKFKYYEVFPPGEPITPPPTKLDNAKEKASKAHMFLAVCVLFAGFMKGCALMGVH